jgi:hypothetical protein
MTTTSPIRKITPMVPPRNLSMADSSAGHERLNRCLVSPPGCNVSIDVERDIFPIHLGRDDPTGIAQAAILRRDGKRVFDWTDIRNSSTPLGCSATTFRPGPSGRACP